MFRKLAVALLAATVLSAPVLAQGTPGATATPPAKTGTAAPAATPKVVAAKPTLKSAKVTTSKRFVGRHFARVKHARHFKAVKSVRTAKYLGAKHFGAKHFAAKHLGAKHHVRHVVRSKPMTRVGAGAANTAKPKSGMN
jgi:hypothetical protein